MNRMTLLAVDDVEANRISLQYLIEEYCDDIDIILASSGEDALKEAYTNEVDLIILDIQMPGMDGFETAKFLKSNPKTEHIPIIFLTAAFKKEEFQQKGFEIGAIDYLAKPIEDHQFINKLKLYKEVIFKTKELEKTNEELNKSLQEEKLHKETIQKQQTELIEQSKMAALGEMIGNIAHQWRQPLSIISTCASGLKVTKELGTLKDDELDKHLEHIIETSNKLSESIDIFRDFSIEGSSSKFNLLQVIDEAIDNKRYLIEKNDIEVIKDIDPSIEIDSFPNSFKQALKNIILNACEVLSVSASENRLIFIKANITKEDDTVEIFIKDNGGGVEESNLPKLFEPYFTTKHQAQGVGLGLHIAYNNIVESMNGKISAKNVEYEYKDKEYKGLEFLIKI